MIENPFLLHPELVSSIPITGQMTAGRLNDRVAEVASSKFTNLPGISIVIRTLNEAATLDRLLEDIKVQDYPSEPELIVLDNESHDHTAAVARSHGARVINKPRDGFTYAKSLNLSMREASNPVVFTTVGHALLSSKHTLAAGAAHFTDPLTAGVFARTLPGPNASMSECLVAIGNILYMKPPHEAKAKKSAIANLGLFAAQNIFVNRDAWEDLDGFDERFESGGEDTDFAIRALASGFKIFEDQAVAVHHTHGLTLANYAKQWIHWSRTLRKPQRLNMAELQARRPDLDFS